MIGTIYGCRTRRDGDPHTFHNITAREPPRRTRARLGGFSFPALSPVSCTALNRNALAKNHSAYTSNLLLVINTRPDDVTHRGAPEKKNIVLKLRTTTTAPTQTCRPLGYFVSILAAHRCRRRWRRIAATVAAAAAATVAVAVDRRRVSVVSVSNSTAYAYTQT